MKNNWRRIQFATKDYRDINLDVKAKYVNDKFNKLKILERLQNLNLHEVL